MDGASLWETGNMSTPEQVARKLYAQWSYPEPPDWKAWDENETLNSVGLCPQDFRKEAEAVIDGLSKVMCMQNGIAECSMEPRCTFETCRSCFYPEALELLTSKSLDA